MATQIFHGLARPRLGSLVLAPVAAAGVGEGMAGWGRMRPDSHVLEQMLRALHQDDSIKRGVLAHDAACAIAAHHELQ